MQEVVGCC